MNQLTGLTSGRWRAARWLVPLAIAGATLFIIASALGTLTGSTFNAGDGNMKIDAGDTHDWQDAATTFGSNYSGAIPDVVADGSDDAFTPGQKQDTPCPEISGQKSPPKDDFTAAAYATETSAATGNIYLYGATFRYAANGNASENIELNQGTNGKCAGSVLFQRVAGDRLIAIDYLSGGTSADFHVLTWVTAGTCFVGNDSPPCWGSNVVTLSPSLAEAKENTSDIPAAENFITSGAVDKFKFAEFGVNLTAALGITGCGKIAALEIEARSSGSSFVSSTKDIIIGTRPLAPCETTLRTQATDTTLGGTIKDVATLTGVPSGAGGTVTFLAYGPRSLTSTTPDCTGTVQYTSVANVTGTGSTLTIDSQTDGSGGAFTPNAAGKYDWKVSYSGDSAHGIVGSNSACGDTSNGQKETSTVGTKQPTLSTNAGSTVLLASGGSNLTDDATLSNASSPNATGTIRFYLYADDGSGGCGTQAGTVDKTGINGNGTYTSPSIHVSAQGVYHWVAIYLGDSNYLGVGDDTSDTSRKLRCNQANENKKVINPLIIVTKSPSSQSVVSGSTVTFTILVRNTSVVSGGLTAADLTLDHVSTGDILAPNCRRPVTSPPADAAHGDLGTLTPNDGVNGSGTDETTYTCTYGPVTGPDVNVVTACGTARDAALSSVCDNSSTDINARSAPFGIEHLSSTNDFKPKDSAAISVSGTGISALNGSLKFELFKGACDSLAIGAGNKIYSDTAAVAGNNTYSTLSADFLSTLVANAITAGSGITAGTSGTYNWRITYSGDTNGNGAVNGACGTEKFVVTNGTDAP